MCASEAGSTASSSPTASASSSTARFSERRWQVVDEILCAALRRRLLESHPVGMPDHRRRNGRHGGSYPGCALRHVLLTLHEELQPSRHLAAGATLHGRGGRQAADRRAATPRSSARLGIGCRPWPGMSRLLEWRRGTVPACGLRLPRLVGRGAPTPTACALVLTMPILASPNIAPHRLAKLRAVGDICCIRKVQHAVRGCAAQPSRRLVHICDGHDWPLDEPRRPAGGHRSGRSEQRATHPHRIRHAQDEQDPRRCRGEDSIPAARK